MVAYLAAGWFAHTKQRRLRAEVVDGALDSAGYLHRAGVTAKAVLALALRVRALTGLVDPLHRHVHVRPPATDGSQRAEQPLPPAALAAAAEAAATRTLGERPLHLLRQQVLEATDGSVELQSFATDCLDHVTCLDALRGLFLHLVHVAQMMRLLALSQKSTAVQMLVAAHDELSQNAQGRIVRLPARP